MFNNRFNSSKNDPLVEAVKAARADGDTRRLAESMTNGLFGVFSRQAVVREHLSDYDFALEEAYKCMSMKEEDKMADKDYDRDGKVETSKKEVWGSRLRAAKASGKYKGPVDEDSSNGLPPSDAAKQAGAAQQAQTPSSTPKRTGNAAGSTISNARDAAGMNEAQLDELKKPTAKTAMDAYHRAYDSDVRSGGEGKRTARLGRWKQKNLSDKSARNQKDTGKAAGMNEAQINELSRTTLKSYVKKANRQATDLERKVNTRKDRPGEEDKMYRRIDGVNLAHDKMKVRVAATNEEALDEISKELAGRYIKKAHYRGGSADFKHGMIHGREMVSRKKSKMDQADAKEFSKTSNKREKGIGLATDKLTGRAKVQANEEVMKESIKAKLLARHMKEDQSFKSAQVIEANAFDLGKTVPDASMKIRGSAYPSVAARIKDMATAAKGIAGAVRGLAKGFGNPVTAGAMIAAEPTPANSGENEFARQAKYAPKTAPTPAATPKPAASTPAVKASTATPATTKPVAAPTSAPAPKPAAAPASAPAKSSYFKGGSMGDTTVKSGQTLSGIAKSTGQSVADLAKMNNISDVNKISAGAKLMTKVPTPAPRPADVSSASTSAPKPAEPTATSSAPVDRTSSNPPTTSGNPTPVGGGAITQDAQKKQKTTQDAGTSSAPAPVAECVQIGANKYRIV